MKSQWFELKDTAIALRREGMSLGSIENRLGIPRSTLSGWLKNIPISEKHRLDLLHNQQLGLAKARKKAAIVHRANKNLRLLAAKQAAQKTLDSLELSNEVLDLALAMLYVGEGKKDNTTALGSSNQSILRFFLYVLERNYGLNRASFGYELHLRMDQNDEELRRYWAGALSVPITQFSKTSYDKRSGRSATFEHYKGVCVVSCGNVAIQRKLMYLYSLFCEQIPKVYPTGD